HERAGGDPPQRGGHPAAAPAHVMGAHRPGERDVGVRVEPSCELARMMVEVAGHLVPAPAVEGVLLPLGPVAEAVLELFGGAIRGVCDAPGDAEPGPWAVVGLVVVAPTEV